MALGPGHSSGAATRPPRVYEVGREKIREFADRDRRRQPGVHATRGRARALGYPDVVAPPTFAIVVTLAARDGRPRRPGVGLDYSRVVHGEQRFIYAPPDRGRRPAGRHHDDRRGAQRGRQRHAHRARRHRRPRTASRSCTAWSRSSPGRRGVSADASTTSRSARAAGADLPRHPRPTWSATPAPPATSTRSTGTTGSPVGRACPTSSPTACSPWRSPAGSSPTGPATRARSSSTASASPGRSSSRTTTRAPR